MKLTKSLMPEGASVQCKGFLFDLDGTLVDSLPAVERAWCNWADRFCLDHAEVLGFIHGKQAITSLRHFMVGKSEAEIAAEFTRLEQIEATETAGITALPGAVDLLNHLNKAGIPWAIVTSGSMPVARARHRVAGLPAPEVFVTAERVKRGKPEPDAYLLGAQLLAWHRRNVQWWKMPPQGCSQDWRLGAMSSRLTRQRIRRVWTKLIFR